MNSSQIIQLKVSTHGGLFGFYTLFFMVKMLLPGFSELYCQTFTNKFYVLTNLQVIQGDMSLSLSIAHVKISVLHIVSGQKHELYLGVTLAEAPQINSFYVLQFYSFRFHDGSPEAY